MNTLLLEAPLPRQEQLQIDIQRKVRRLVSEHFSQFKEHINLRRITRTPIQTLARLGGVGLLAMQLSACGTPMPSYLFETPSSLPKTIVPLQRPTAEPTKVAENRDPTKLYLDNVIANAKKMQLHMQTNSTQHGPETIIITDNTNVLPQIIAPADNTEISEIGIRDEGYGTYITIEFDWRGEKLSIEFDNVSLTDESIVPGKKLKKNAPFAHMRPQKDQTAFSTITKNEPGITIKIWSGPREDKNRKELSKYVSDSK